MSDDNVITLRPDMSELESFSKNERDQILQDNRDDMLAFLDGMRGRIMAYDIRGIVMVGFAVNRCDDVTYESEDTLNDALRTVGSLEFIKQSVIDRRLREMEDEEE